MVGNIVTIKPGSLHNRGRLFTTQDWIDTRRVLNAINNPEDTPPVCGFFVIKGIRYVM